MKYTFQHFVDISTSAESMQLIQIQAGGRYLINRCRHLIGAYKHYKLGRVSIKLVPASTLPVDPLGLSYGDTDPQTVDPRDQLNPGLVRITNGEDIFTDIASLNAEQQENVYKATMLDPRWSKFMLQGGFRRSAVPLFWSVGMLHQNEFPGTIVNVPGRPTDYLSDVVNSFQFGTTAKEDMSYSSRNIPYRVNSYDSDPRSLFQTGHKQRMSWLPTDMLQEDAQGNLLAGLAPVLSPNVISVLLPKAYKTLYFYRLFITETVFFSGLKNVGIGSDDDDSLSYIDYRGIDNFTYSGVPVGAIPGNAMIIPYSTGPGLVTRFGSTAPMNDGDSLD